MKTAVKSLEFLSVDNLLEKHDSANAVAMFQTIQCNLQACTLSTDKLIGLATDGASVTYSHGWKKE